jgi:hypothetical protein
VQTHLNCEILTISIRDLLKMKLEFPKIFGELFHDVSKKFHKELGLKIQTIRQHEKVKMLIKPKNKMRSNFTYNILGDI